MSPTEDWDTGISFIVNPDNRDFGGLNTSDAPEEGSEDWAFLFPLYGFSHGGQCVSISPYGCKWDSGQIGFVGITKDSLKNYFGKDKTEKEARGCIEAFLTDLNFYLAGDAWVVQIQQKTCDKCDTWETIESVGGYFGRDNAETVGKEMLEEQQKTI
jgi:hypothetical protein